MLLQWIGFGVIVAPLLVTVFFVAMQALDLRSHVKKDIPYRRQVWANTRYLPHKIYHTTDWAVFSRSLVVSVPIGGVFMAIDYLLVVGFIEVFL